MLMYSCESLSVSPACAGSGQGGTTQYVVVICCVCVGLSYCLLCLFVQGGTTQAMQIGCARYHGSMASCDAQVRWSGAERRTAWDSAWIGLLSVHDYSISICIYIHMYMHIHVYMLYDIHINVHIHV